MTDSARSTPDPSADGSPARPPGAEKQPTVDADPTAAPDREKRPRMIKIDGHPGKSDPDADL